MATIAGRRVGGPRIPWNPRQITRRHAGVRPLRRRRGRVPRLVVPAGIVIPPPYSGSRSARRVAAAVAARWSRRSRSGSTTTSRSRPRRRPCSGGSSLVSEDCAFAGCSEAPRLPLAAGGERACRASPVYRAGRSRCPGADRGAVIGIVICVTRGLGGMGAAARRHSSSRWSRRGSGCSAKSLLGIAEDRGGRRGAGNAIANTGVAAIAAVLSALTLRNRPGAARIRRRARRGGSDTMASEIGKAWGRRTYLVPTLRPRAAGHVRARFRSKGRRPVSRARLRSARSASRLASSRRPRCVPIVAGATVGAFAESPLGATLEASRHPQQRPAELPEHGDRGGRRDRSGRERAVTHRRAGAAARVLAAVHPRRAGTRLRLGRRDRGRRPPARARGAPTCSSTRASALVMAAVLNAASNALNQIYDLEIDRINKPARPLPSGRLSIREAWIFTWITYAVALVLAWLVAPGGRHECFWIVARRRPPSRSSIRVRRSARSGAASGPTSRSPFRAACC